MPPKICFYNNYVMWDKFKADISQLIFTYFLSSNRKSKKTAKLFWKEIRNSQAFGSMSNANNNTIWDDMEPAAVDTAMIEYLFENRAKEASGSGKDNKPAQLSSAREIIVLDHKRSNAINIGMTKLPPPRVIKSAVMKMDSAIMNR